MTSPWPELEKGAGILRSTAAHWTNFSVITTASPWKLAEALLPKPKAVIVAQNLDRRTLEPLRQQVVGSDLIVGIGSGIAMDTAKYLAKVEQLPLALVISTSSNNACFTRTAWTFEGGSRIAEREVPIPRQLIVDYDLLRQAPARLNRAGAAEILCSHTALFDWRLAHEAGVDVQWDNALEQSTRDELEALVDYASDIGAAKLEAFVRILEVGAKFAAGFTSHPKARFNAGSEHILAWALEELSGQRLLHGEAVSLGILLMAHIQGNRPETAAAVIRKARIPYQPEDLGITWSAVERIVMQLPQYAARLPWYTIIDEFARRGADGQRDLAEKSSAAQEFVRHLR